MLLSAVAVALGLVLLVWSADRFVSGASAFAAHKGMPPLLIGMVIVGFGTSAPEITVSAIAAAQGTTQLALGNAWGSNIANIGLILGLTAVLAPLAVRSEVLRREMPILVAVTALTIVLCLDLSLGRIEGTVLLLVFLGVFGWSLWTARRGTSDPLGDEVPHSAMSPRSALLRTAIGLVLLIIASRVLVWGAVRLAQGFGVSELVIGLTVVAVGTSLPELASSLVAIRRKAHEIALGNIIGSNLFNTLAVAGLALVISPTDLPASVLTRDLAVMGALTLALVAAALPLRRRPGRLNRLEGAALLTGWGGYTTWLIATSPA